MCSCVDLLFTHQVIAVGSLRKVYTVDVECAKCGKPWRVREIADGAVMLLASDSLEERRRQETAELSSKKIQKRTAADDVIDLWTSITSLPRSTVIPKNVIQALCDVPKDKNGLIVGADLISLAVDRNGGHHVAVVEDCAIADALRPVLVRTEIQSGTWRPDYGVHFHGMVIGCELDNDWLMYIKRSLAPDGNVFLLGAAIKHKEELVDAWGLDAKLSGGGIDRFCLLVPHPDVLGDGPGTELSNAIGAMGMPSCQQCHNLAKKMNAWGVVGCRDHLDEIVDEITPRALAWWDNSDYRTRTAAWWRSASSALAVLYQAYKAAPSDKVEDHRVRLLSMLRVQVRVQVVKAINQYAMKTKNR